MVAPMSRRQGLIFTAGLLVGMATGAGLLLGLQHGDPASRLVAQALAQPASPAPVKQAAACAFEPLLAASEGTTDGRYRIQSAGTQATPQDLPAYLAVGADAAAQGRVRDAETAYIIACRMAGQATGVDSAELADAKYQLASHYLQAANEAQVTSGFDEIRQRAEMLFGESIDVYGMKLGIDHEKTRQAVAGLSAVKAAVAQGGGTPHAVPRELLMARADEYVQAAALVPKKKPKPVSAEEAREARPETTAMGAPAAPKAEPAPEPKAKSEPRPESPPMQATGEANDP
jgi:hypothetical protein